MTNSSPSSSPPTSSSPGDTTAGSPSEPARPDARSPVATGSALPGQSPVGGTAPPSLDLCGELCPFTFVRAKLALEELPIGAMLRVIVDHEPATRNIPRSATEWGQEVLGVTAAGDGTWTIELRRRVR